MTAQKETKSDSRRKRVQTLKKLIILSLITSILLPTVLCVVLFIRVNALEGRLEQLAAAIEEAGQYQAANAGGQMSENGSSQGFIMEPEVVDNPQEGREGPADTGEAPTEAGPEATEPARKVYLTFDDGPSTYTDDILDILAEYDVKATFFVVGKEGEWAEDAYKRIVEEGHTLGMHTYTHEYDRVYASVEAFDEDLGRLQEYLYEVTGVWSRYVRFPGGSSNKVSKVDMREFITYLNEEGLVYFDWNVSSQDASRVSLTAEEIVDNCMDGIEKYDTVVILMHDAAGRRSTVEALPILIEKIKAMENTELLPITEDTVPVQHIKITQEETED